MKAQRLSPQQQKTQLQLDKISAAFRQHFQTGNYQQAMREALKAHKLAPKSTAPLSDAATAAVKAGLWNEAGSGALCQAGVATRSAPHQCL